MDASGASSPSCQVILGTMRTWLRWCSTVTLPSVAPLGHLVERYGSGHSVRVAPRGLADSVRSPTTDEARHLGTGPVPRAGVGTSRRRVLGSAGRNLVWCDTLGRSTCVGTRVPRKGPSAGIRPRPHGRLDALATVQLPEASRIHRRSSPDRGRPTTAASPVSPCCCRHCTRRCHRRGYR
jgi:hypothetical protein